MAFRRFLRFCTFFGLLVDALDFSLSVSHFMMYLVMAGTAEGHEVVPLMRSAFADRKDMVYLVHQREATFLVTHLTERVLPSIPIPDSFPGPSVLFMYIRSTCIFVVLSVYCSSVLFTVLSV